MAGGVEPRATFVQRLLAVIIDSVLLSVLVGIFAVVSVNLGYVVALVAGLAYITYFEGSPSGQTVGKRVMNIRVVDFEGGGPIDYQKAFIRAVGRYVSGAVCYLGFLWMLWDADKQTWHDKFVKTTVVPVADFPVEKWPG